MSERQVVGCEIVGVHNHHTEGTEGQEGFFPHLYNGNNLGEKEIESVSEVIRGDEEGAKWDDALASLVSLDWLVY